MYESESSEGVPRGDVELKSLRDLGRGSPNKMVVVPPRSDHLNNILIAYIVYHLNTWRLKGYVDAFTVDVGR